MALSFSRTRGGHQGARSNDSRTGVSRKGWIILAVSIIAVVMFVCCGGVIAFTWLAHDQAATPFPRTLN